MEYKIQQMIGDADNVRYALIQKGTKTLYVIGLNPSTANEIKPDSTMNKVMGFAETNGFDGFVMLNLYPQRSTNPNGLHQSVNQEYSDKNLEIIEQILSQEIEPTVLFAYGNNIGLRKYLKESAKSIKQICDKYKAHKVCVALTKYGMPKHPLYVRYGFFLEYK